MNPRPRQVRKRGRTERLQKIMATAGLGSRRAIEARIDGGLVTVNGESARIGATAGAGDVIEMDGRAWRVVDEPARFRTLIYNKPVGEVTTRSDPQGRPTVFDRLPRLRNQRWIAIGRLDINTSGLLLLTTDGELADAMMRPASNVDREYACRIYGEVSEEQLERLRSGVELADGKAQFSDITAAVPGSEPGTKAEGHNRWFHVTLMEGRNREVRRLWESQGLKVSRLKRVRYGAAFLPRRMRVGRWREISPGEHRILREDVGLDGAASVLTLEAVAPGTKARRPGKRRGRRT